MQTTAQSSSANWAAEYRPEHISTNIHSAFAAPLPSAAVPSGYSPKEYQRYLDSYNAATSVAQDRQSSYPIPRQPAQQTTPSHHVAFTDRLNPLHYPRFGMQRPYTQAYNGSFGLSQHRLANFTQEPIRTTAQTKGKSRMVELDDRDWEKQFAKMDSTKKDELEKKADETTESELNRMDEDYVQLGGETNEYGDFESIWRGIQSENEAMRNLSTEEERILNGGHPVRSFDTWDNFDGNFNAYPGDANLGNYIFSDEAPLFDSSLNPFEEGMNIISSRGNLSLAASAFEAAVQKDPTHVEAWVMLGTAQAQNEKENQAIRAFEQALKLDPANLSALMGLAISYTNEGYEATAYRTLEKWLSTKYPSVLDPQNVTQDADFGFQERQALHDRVTNLYIRAAQLSPSGTSMDPDVQVGLGVLFYGAEEYSKAVDCFEAALASTEAGVVKEPYQAHLLWNRLGATLANSGRSEEAIAAYGEALAMNPNFVRAKYNLGVSCINIGCLEEAAQHLLGALSMHEVVKEKGIERAREVGGKDTVGNGEYGIGGLLGGTNLIETLRRVFNSMGRKDLAQHVETGVVDLEVFRGEFDF